MRRDWRPREVVPGDRGMTVLRRSSAVPHGVGEEIHSHSKRGLALLRRVPVHFGVFPSIAEVGLVRVVHDESPIEKNPEALCRFLVMLVDLGQAARKVVYEMVDG